MKEAVVIATLFFALLAFTSCTEDHDEDNPTVPQPETTYGMAVLSIQSPRFQLPTVDGTLCEQTIRTVNRSPRPGIAFAYAIFGYEETCLKAYTDSNKGRKHGLRVYAIDESHRDGDGQWVEGRLWRDVSTEALNERFHSAAHLDDFYARLDDVKAMIERVRNDNTEVTIVPFLEHTLDDEAARNAALFTRSRLPYRVELNPLHAWSDTKEFPKELHGKGIFCSGKVKTLSQDGSYYSPEDNKEFVANTVDCNEIYLWPYELQGISYVNGHFEKAPGPFPERPFKFTHEEEYSEIFTNIAGQ